MREHLDEDEAAAMKDLDRLIDLSQAEQDSFKMQASQARQKTLELNQLRECMEECFVRRADLKRSNLEAELSKQRSDESEKKRRELTGTHNYSSVI